MSPTLRWAAWLCFIYAAIILVNATIGQVSTDWADARDYVRGLIRVGGYIGIGVGLLRRSKGVWWIGVGITGWLLLLALVAFGAMFALRDSAGMAALPPMFVLVAIVTTGLLLGIFVLLVHPQTRATWRAD